MVTISSSGPLLQLLVESYPSMSRNRLKQYLQQGRILVNGNVVTRHDFSLRAGDTVDIGQAGAAGRQLNSRYLSLVYEDRHLMVIDKAAGILSMATSVRSLCVKDVLDAYLERMHQPCRVHVVHRLDRDTSGLMVFAKSRGVQQMLETDWKNLVYDRRYVAVASGHVEQEEGTVRSWLSESSRFVTYSSPTDNGGKLAITHYRVLRYGADNTLVEAHLDTGRKNQIRVHLADIGHPVVGDRKYGSDADGRLCLHAYRLHFIHPVTGRRMLFDTPVPADFIKAL